MQSTKASKNHHFVPRFLLGRFSNSSGRVYFLRKGKDSKPLPMLPTEVMYEKHSNTFTDADGAANRSVEGDLQKLESLTAPILEMVCNTIRNGRVPKLGSGERRIVGEFLLTLFKRNPAIRSQHATKELVDDVVSRSLQEFETRFGPVTEANKRRFSDDDWIRKALKQASVQATLMHQPEVLNTVVSRGYIFAVPKNKKKGFVLGSRPLLMLRGKKHNGLGDPSSECWLPIAHDVALCSNGFHDSDSILELTDQEMRHLNLNTWKQSEMAISRSDQLLSSLRDWR